MAAESLLRGAACLPPKQAEEWCSLSLLKLNVRAWWRADHQSVSRPRPAETLIRMVLHLSDSRRRDVTAGSTSASEKGKDREVTETTVDIWNRAENGSVRSSSFYTHLNWNCKVRRGMKKKECTCSRNGPCQFKNTLDEEF